MGTPKIQNGHQGPQNGRRGLEKGKALDIGFLILWEPQKSKNGRQGAKMADKVWKGVYPKVFGCSCQLSLNMIFDPSTPSMREVNDGEKMAQSECGTAQLS